MHIRVINPNTTAAMTAKIEASARAVAGPGTVVEAVNPAMGPASIESHYDEALSVPGMLAEIAAGRDGPVSTGTSSPASATPAWTRPASWRRGPVVGIAEAAMHAAGAGRPRFQRGHHARPDARAGPGTWPTRYGAGRACSGVHACDIPVLELDKDPAVLNRVVALAREALDARRLRRDRARLRGHGRPVRARRRRGWASR